MIYVRVELWPFGNKEKASVLGEAHIWNKGSRADATRADYGFRLFGKRSRPMGEGEITDFPRRRLLAWDLVQRVLTAARKAQG